MKIVLFNKQEKAGGGIGVFTKRFKDFLSKQGHEVFELRYSNEPESKDFIRIPYIADKQAYIYLPSLKTSRLVRSHLKIINPDLVYFPIGASTFDFFIPEICRKLSIPLFGVFHADISRTNKLTRLMTSLPFRLYLPVCKKVDLLQIFSSDLKRFLVKKGVPENKIVVIPNGVDTKRYSPGKSAFKEKMKIKKYILYLGRLMWEKNPEVLIKSFLKIKDKDAKIIIAGAGDLEQELRDKYESDRVIFLGQIGDEEIKIDIIRGADVFVLPSGYEGMSLSLLEAMSSGLTCVASDVASQRQMLRGVGIVIPFDRLKHDLPRVLGKTLKDEQLRKRLGEGARKKVIKEYSQEKIFDRLLKEFVRISV